MLTLGGPKDLAPARLCTAGQDRVEAVLHRHAVRLGASVLFDAEFIHHNDNPAFTSPPENCPFAPPDSIAVGGDLVGVLPCGAAALSALVSRPAVYSQTLAQWRIDRGRSNHKRGPPTA